MKKHSIIIITIIVTVVFQSFHVFALLAQDRLKDKISGYAEQNMLPKLSEWKSTLDNGLSTEEMNLLYNSADGVIQLSNAEGWGLSLTEAMLTGTPFIAAVCFVAQLCSTILVSWATPQRSNGDGAR